ncbi:aminopeptidase P family protein [Saccharopolyspora erythraea]|uniref:M24 family metallopeptidase n=1 Tax=Saccharopolyspora erythraea TaxID=1836 RepID=UPI001BA7986A|nr:Xaa-Pro peptidase family protein [Saccharopolyspora erythraea]QUH02256.1 aminopeptidase P family protein [Saccharopolyspora erythraea]
MTACATSSTPATTAGRRVHEQRIRALRHQMRAGGLGAVALTRPEDIYYLTGLDHLGYFAFTLLVVPLAGEPTLVTRRMEGPTVRAKVPWCRHATFGEDESPASASAAVLAEACGTYGDGIALDEESMFFPPSVAGAIRARLPHVRWSCASSLLAAQRARKSPEEIDCIRRAAAISDLALSRATAMLRPGVAERDVAAEIYRCMIEEGGQPPGFPPLIRPASVLEQEHVSWSDGALASGQGLFFELSASVRRYHAPQSRTIYIGQAPAAAAEAAEVALAGLLAALDALEPGARTREVYAAWQRAVAGHADPRRHHCGYLVGIGFPPSWVGGANVLGIRPGGDVVLRAGMTFHLMSWVNRPVGHVISDTALVTDSGAELLTTTPRELITIR